MNNFTRCLFPVGHGGFAVEVIDNSYLTVFDCGSDLCPVRVSHYIDFIKDDGLGPVNRLFISHFDNDHVNCIRDLISKVGVREVVVPSIPKELRFVYNAYTNGAYFSILDLFQNNENSERRAELVEVDDQGGFYKHDVWEWYAHNMLTEKDWEKLKDKLAENNIQINQIGDADYVEKKRQDINNCFIDVFGSKGPNSKGLVVLSQRTINTNMTQGRIKHGWPWKHVALPANYSGCLYTGDADLKNKGNRQEVLDFVRSKKHEQSLLLTQIPHHGSCHNVYEKFDQDFISEYYFYCDNTSVRLQKNGALYQNLVAANKLLEIRDVCDDLVLNEIILH